MTPRRYGSRGSTIQTNDDYGKRLLGLLDSLTMFSPMKPAAESLLYAEDYPVAPFATPEDRFDNLMGDPKYQGLLTDAGMAGQGLPTGGVGVLEKLRLTRTSPGTGKPLSVDFEPARGGSKLGHYQETLSKLGYGLLDDDDLRKLREDHREIKKIRDQRANQDYFNREYLRNTYGSEAPKITTFEGTPKKRLKKIKKENKRREEYQRHEELRKRLGDIRESQRNEWLSDKSEKFATPPPEWNKKFHDEFLEEMEIAKSIGSNLSAVKRSINRANIEAVSRALKKQGWNLRHASTNKAGRKSSRYLVSPEGKEFRLSDHELPMHPEREHRQQQYGTRWDYDVVLSGDEKPDEIIQLLLNPEKNL